MNAFGIMGAVGAAAYAVNTPEHKKHEAAVATATGVVTDAIPAHGHGSVTVTIPSAWFPNRTPEEVRHAIYQSVYDKGAFVTKIADAGDGKMTITANRTTKAQAIQDKFMAKGLWT